MMGNQKRDVKKYFFTLPNVVFELGLHVYELAIYAYLLRIEDRRTWQCVVSYPTIADKLGISVNTVAKYVGQLEEHGLITTERTDVITRDGLKRNGCLRYTILPIQNAIALYQERQLSALEQAAAQQRAQGQAEKYGVEFVTPDKGQSALPYRCAACDELCAALAVRVEYTAPPKLQGAVCGLCVPSVWLSRTKMFGCSSRSI